jgi:UDP-GlcNAc:undecaprenyl-phosphate GlcNAc-1-phosphate transferase
MVVLSIMGNNYLYAMYFAVLGGAILGFLRYNFNQASIFLGDGGSYFLGYAVAALSIMGQVKSQVGALMLIPVLALGVPVFDTILAPLRRWVKGQQMFQPDRGHIHHRLLSTGLSSRNVVLILYGATLTLCLMAILIVNLRNEMIGLILIIIAGGVLILMHKTGYLGYLAFDKFYGWFKDMTDVTGFSRERRAFLALQMEANKVRTLEELWAQVGEALEMLEFDWAELRLKTNRGTLRQDQGDNEAQPPHRFSTEHRDDNFPPSPSTDPYNGPERRFPKGDAPPPKSSKIFQNIRELEDEIIFTWTREYYRRHADFLKEDVLKIDLPLNADGNGPRILLMKDLTRDPLHYYTLRRLEHLRRTLHFNLNRLQKGK